ncbi:MAG: DUF4296 domain-containing protein [Bacteroidota bacterium]|nr:DUF4296 domain-containing protein [Bacteroidota bacterium]MEC7286566.1 DUF4296 domain-containing protein [Bacteroidota bacterium]MEC7548956.1 DUF4296 domain-containing protein [Bacteroidota bacterium]MEC8097698.1 DUF4296 domain-containing protein [Bacteroidota bacterium]MEC8364074.1 DUF4296 domain-containing protein [Bacteroidota bacterium]
MKKLIFLVLFTLIYCSVERVNKPSKLLSESEMVSLLVDISIVNASLNFSEKNFSDLNSIFDYHEIDSITFVENNIYYVSKPKIYMKIFDSVKFELEEIQDGLSQELLDNVNYDEKYLKNQNKK